jgi:hypothetical protein
MSPRSVTAVNAAVSNVQTASEYRLYESNYHCYCCKYVHIQAVHKQRSTALLPSLTNSATTAAACKFHHTFTYASKLSVYRPSYKQLSALLLQPLHRLLQLVHTITHPLMQVSYQRTYHLTCTVQCTTAQRSTGGSRSFSHQFWGLSQQTSPSFQEAH